MTCIIVSYLYLSQLNNNSMKYISLYMVFRVRPVPIVFHIWLPSYFTIEIHLAKTSLETTGDNHAISWLF